MSMKWTGHVARMGRMRNAYKILVRKLMGRDQLKKTRRRWKKTLKLTLKEQGVILDVMCLIQYKDQWRTLVNTVMNLRVP
jgi:hypothetical protein